MKKVIIFCLLLAGCGTAQRSCTSITGEFTYKCSKSGIEYVQSDSGISPHLQKDGTPVECSE